MHERKRKGCVEGKGGGGGEIRAKRWEDRYGGTCRVSERNRMREREDIDKDRARER